MFSFRCCFQNLFLLLLLGHWPETSLLKAAISHSLPAILHWLATLTVQRKLTSVVVNWEYRQVCGSSLLVETEGCQAMPSKFSPIILIFGHWSPGFWCCSSWCQSLDLSTFQQHHLPLPKMLCVRGTAVMPSCWGYLKILSAIGFDCTSYFRIFCFICTLSRTAVKCFFKKCPQRCRKYHL